MFHVEHRTPEPMKDLSELHSLLLQLDGRGYKAYREIRGTYDAGTMTLHVDHVQGDPFADLSRFRAVVAPAHAGFPDWVRASAARRRAAADFVNRRLAQALDDASSPAGSGKSGQLSILVPGQEILERASTTMDPEGGLVARFRVGLPARGRRVLGRAAAELVRSTTESLRSALFFHALDESALRRHLETVEDAVALRAALPVHGLVAFVADGAVLPRRSGVDDRPLTGAAVVPFKGPEALRVEILTPNGGFIRGMGVPAGVTLIVGGGYHGKSTLLRALERGVYDHVPGDGRERVVTHPAAVKVRAEDGRAVAGTDISNFISRLPGGEDTTRFRTENASGSTSQAAAIVEALELGASALLLDEDTSATNFMIRDARMQRLVAAEDEPITPFIDRVRALHGERGVSTIVVVGGSGDYFDVADTVISMKRYRPEEVTARAREVARRLPTERRAEAEGWHAVRRRVPLPASVDPSRGRREVSIRVRSRDRVDFGRDALDLGAVEQLVEVAQTRAIAHALAMARDEWIDGRRSMPEALDCIIRRMQRRGVVALHPHELGELAEFRVFELGAALNRLRRFETGEARDAPAGGSG